MKHFFRKQILVASFKVSIGYLFGKFSKTDDFKFLDFLQNIKRLNPLMGVVVFRDLTAGCFANILLIKKAIKEIHKKKNIEDFQPLAYCNWSEFVPLSIPLNNYGI